MVGLGKVELTKFFDSRSFTRMLETVTTANAAKYAFKELTDIVKKNGLQESLANLIEETEKWVHSVVGIEQKKDETKAMAGELVETAYNIYQTLVAKEAINELNVMPKGDVNFAFAINDSTNPDERSQFLRGIAYMDGGEVEQKTSSVIDEIYLAWLSSVNLVSKDGAIYRAHENGKVVQENGKDVKIDPQEFIQLIEGKVAAVDGIEAFSTKKSDGKIHIVPNEQKPFPAPEEHAAPTTKGG